MTAPDDEPRRRELADALAAVRHRVAEAEAAASRPAGCVELVVVTKTFPASDVRLLAGLGVDQVGESREPHASATAAACADLPLRWHQVGQVQTRKAGAVVAWADVVHSVDRPRLVGALARAAATAGRRLECLLQVRLDEPDGGEVTGGPGVTGDPERTGGGGGAGRGGAHPSDVPALAEAVAAEPSLLLGGVMAVAPRTGEPARAFDRLAEVSASLRADHPGAVTVSAGMSGDLEVAVARGATVVRVGTAILGSRPSVR